MKLSIINFCVYIKKSYSHLILSQKYVQVIIFLLPLQQKVPNDSPKMDKR